MFPGTRCGVNTPTFAQRMLRIVLIFCVALGSGLLGSALLPAAVQAQGSMSLSTGHTANNGAGANSSIMFNITALQPVQIYRFSSAFGTTGTDYVEIWAKAGGIVANDNTGWTFVGRAQTTVTNTTGDFEIPVNMNFNINPNQTYGFAIFSPLGVRYQTGVTGTYITSDSWISINTESYASTGSTNWQAGTVSFGYVNYPRQLCGTVKYDPGVVAPNDAALFSLTSPVNFCGGTEPIKVRLFNMGNNTLTSVQINWTFDGIPQTPLYWTGSLPSTANEEVTLGTKTFNPGVLHNIVAISSLPNGVQDTRISNDTLMASVKPALSGTFTVGGASPDYANLTDALADIHATGLCGPVVLKVRSGTYNEQMRIGRPTSITGVSSVNTITIESESGNRGDVTVTYASTTGNPTLVIDNTDYVTIRNMTIRATNPSDCRALHITGGAEHCTFENLDLISMPTTTISNVTAVVESPSGSLDNYMTFRNCNIQNGSYGMYMYGSGTTATEDFNVIENCTFTGQYYYPLYMYYIGELSFLGNTVVQNSAYTTKYLGLFYYGYNTKMERNTFLADGGTYSYGVYLYYDNYYQTGESRFVNNFVSVMNSTSTTYGVRPYYCDNLLFAHNTVYTKTPYTSSYTVYSYYGSNQRYYNNIFYTDGPGMNWYVPSTTSIIASDFNVFHTNGSSFGYWGGTITNLAALQAASGMDANSIDKLVSFKNTLTGDLHLASPSDDDIALFGTLLTEVTDDIDGDTRVNPYRGADEACYVIPGSLNYSFVDEYGYPAAYCEAPGSIGVKYSVTFPEFASTVGFTVRFINVHTETVVWQTSFNANKAADVALNGVQYITLPSSLPPGAYKIEVVFNTKNSCDVYHEYMPYPSALLVVGTGQQPCVVWPGDVNNDAIVNYTDRRALNLYIFNANLRTTWLNGPARYQADVESNPFTYLEWKPQAGAPWLTPEGCYMDTDGNGVVNNLDYVAMKINWAQSTPYYGGTPKSGNSNANSFAMDQNYPNPFNPTTVIRYHVQENSNVRLTVTDALGRAVATLVDGIVESGTHEVTFDASSLSSGTYIATINMTGASSGVTFTKNIKMALSK